MEIDSKVEEFMNLTHMGESLHRSVALAKSQVTVDAVQELIGAKLTPEAGKAMGQYQDKVALVMSDAIGWERLKPAYVQLFAETYTESELDGILAFYKSPPGQAMVAKNPLLMSRASEIMQQRMAEAQPELQKLMRDFVSEQAKN